MKLFISFILASFCASANTVVIYDTSELGYGAGLQSRFTEEYEIPAQLVRLYQVKNCPAGKEFSNRLVLCVKRKELEILSSNPSIIKSLAVFKSEAK